MFKFFENNKNKIEGFVGCFDRIRLKGHLQGYAYPAAMQHHLYKEDIRIFDYPQYAKQLADKYKEHVKEIAAKNNIEIQHVNSYKISKEKIVQEILKKKGHEKGLVHIISAVESTRVYKPSFNKKTKKSELVSRMGKCLHYYFYFIEPVLGLCYFRVATWMPFGVQFYCNGHHYLYKQLDRKGVPYTALDNALVKIDNFKAAQREADKLTPELVMKRLCRYQNKFCPMAKWLDSEIYWIIDQAEYSTDFVFKDVSSLKSSYDNIIKKALGTVKPENVYSFLGKKLTGNYQGELGNDFKTRTCGTRIKHYARDASIKMYDKFGKVLRIETTVNNLNFFRTRRTVDKRDGTHEENIAPMRKSIFSLTQLRSLLFDCNKRYIDFIASIDDPTTGQKNLEKVTNNIVQNGRRYRGLNFFEKEDQKLLSVINDPKYYITGLSNKSIREKYKSKSTGQISRLLKNLRVHGVIKKIPNQYKYFVTRLGKAIINAGIEITAIMIPNRLAV